MNRRVSKLSQVVHSALTLVLALTPLVAPRSSAASPSGAPFITFTQVADSSTAIPGSASNFQFFSALASEANDVAFVGGAGAVDVINLGVYKALNVLMPQPPPIKVADLFTAVPTASATSTPSAASR
jgi:hypothetical protein